MERLLSPKMLTSKGSRALEIMLRAWQEGEAQEVAPEMMAYAALFTALTDLVEHFGEDAVIRMTTRLTRRVREGEFSHKEASVAPMQQ